MTKTKQVFHHVCLCLYESGGVKCLCLKNSYLGWVMFIYILFIEYFSRYSKMLYPCIYNKPHTKSKSIFDVTTLCLWNNTNLSKDTCAHFLKVLGRHVAKRILGYFPYLFFIPLGVWFPFSQSWDWVSAKAVPSILWLKTIFCFELNSWLIRCIVIVIWI